MIEHHVHCWPKDQLVRLTPIQWAVRWIGIPSSLTRQHLFNRRLRRAISRFGIEEVLRVVEEMIADPKAFMLPERDDMDRLRRDGFDPFQLFRQKLIECFYYMNPRIPELIPFFGKIADAAPFEAVVAIERQTMDRTAHLACDSLRLIFHCYAGDEERILGFRDWGDTDGNYIAGRAVSLIAWFEKRRALPFLEEVLLGDYHMKVKEAVVFALGKMSNRQSVALLAVALKIPELKDDVRWVLKMSKLIAARRLLESSPN